MKHRRSPKTLTISSLAGAALALTACMAPPPQAAVRSGSGTVRADTPTEAGAYSLALADLRPRILRLVPDARFEGKVEVWLQDTPKLYAFPASASSEAEGLWSERHGRILLSRDADDPIRTLAHELTHAALGPSWSALPGSLEEGLCDVVAGHLVPEGAVRLRAGRLASAALAAGGLRLRFELWPAGTVASQVDSAPRRPRTEQPLDSTRLVLTGRDSDPVDPLEVFQVEAGLSTTELESGTKRGFYGLAYLVVGSIVERHGLAGLNKLCTEAQLQGADRVPVEWLLPAAGLDSTSATWRRRAAAGFGPHETQELLTMYPTVTQDGARELYERAAKADLGEVEVWALVEGSERAVRVPPTGGARFGRPIPASTWRR